MTSLQNSYICVIFDVELYSKIDMKLIKLMQGKEGF